MDKHGKASLLCAMASALCISSISLGPARAFEWTINDLQFQYGNIKNPFTNSRSYTPIVTFENITGFSWGDTYFFVDMYSDGRRDGYNDKDAYSEGYAFLSSKKIIGANYGGLIKDVGVFGAYNYGVDANYLAFYTGAYVDWNVPHFTLLRSYIAWTFDRSDFHEKNGLHWDTLWTLPFEIGSQRFLFTGHMEWMQRKRNDFGKTKDWFLTQPQLRWDIGYALTGKKDVFQIGTEYQYWHNKLGTDRTESAFQALAVYTF